jgi:protein TonB
MDGRKSSARTSLSFMVSMLLHSSAIAIIALGPTFMPGLKGLGGSDTSTVEFQVEGNQVQTAADIQPVVVPPPAEVTEVIKPEVKVAPVVKAVPVVKAAKKVVAKAPDTVLPEKAVEVTEESDVVVPVTEKVAAAPVDEEPLPAPVVSEEVPVEAAVAPQETVVQDTAAEELAAKQAEETAANNAAGAGNGAANAEAQTAAGSPEVIEVTQNYLGLRQLPGNQPPKYSRDMRLKQMQGRGQLVYFVNKEGKVSEVKLAKSTGHSELDQAAKEAFAKYKFVPGQEGYTLHEFEFSLKGPAESDAGRLRTTYNR